ncbi:MAG TPA: CRISPR-associated endonuclease Cas2 [Syntrophobacter fumaroxidans]|nr:CRISPR-associated endonuclease Cas2 [Syntrophobacter fumaroxidans]
MGEDKHWHLVCYDIRDPKRWYKAYRILKGCGEHLQYSIFRVQMNRTRLEAMRWELSKVLKDEEDDLMIVRLCPACARRVIDSRGSEPWTEPPSRFQVF